MKILLVEDDTEISDMLRNFLISENFEVTAAFDGESACGEFFADESSALLWMGLTPVRKVLSEVPQSQKSTHSICSAMAMETAWSPVELRS